MRKTLFIAEKLKVAVELLKSPRFKTSQRCSGDKPYYGYYEKETYMISWCRGHLLELRYPEEMEERHKEFKFKHLPIILEVEYKEKLEFVSLSYFPLGKVSLHNAFLHVCHDTFYSPLIFSFFFR